MVITLLIPPLSADDRMGSMSAGGAVMPGLGLLYIGALLRQEGFDVNILDAEVNCYNVEKTVERLVELNTDVLGITTTTLSILPAMAVARAFRKVKPGSKVFLGGPHVTAVPDETMELCESVDGCILGDGEESFLKVVKNISNNLPCGDRVDGIIWRQDGQIINYPKTFHVTDVDKLPFPAWDMLDNFPNAYRPPFHSYRRLPVANIITARGCPYKCSFCDRSVFGSKINSHSVDYVIEMLEKLVRDFGIREISIKDDTFVMSESRVYEFCRKIRNRNINLAWSCNARVNTVNEKMLSEMKRAGCWMVSYGIESGSEKMLQKMKKKINRDSVVNALAMTRKAGLISKGFLMIGIPGETEQTLNETLKFVPSLQLDEINVNFFTPFPGSELFSEVVNEGFSPDYSRMNMLEPVYVPQHLTERILYKFQKKIIYAFYLRFSKLSGAAFRSFKNREEFLRLIRMGRLFLAVVSSRK